MELNGLAILYTEQGKYAEAELLYQRAFSIREQRSQNLFHNLANLYREQGKYVEAERSYKRLLSIRE